MSTAVTMTDTGLNLMRDGLRGVETDIKIKYVAVGTDSTAASASDTTLGAEVFRKIMTSTADGASDGEATFTLSLSPQDAVGEAIAEVGWFAGADASATADTGVLVARVLYSHSKTANESINLVFTDSLTAS